MSLMRDFRRAARLELEENRRRAEREHQRSLKVAYARAPELESVDNAIRVSSFKLARKIALNQNTDEIQKELNTLRTQRNLLLKDAGMPENATDFKPFCPMCNDTGKINGKSCKCYDRAFARAILKSSGIAPLCATQTFKTSNPALFSDLSDPKYGLSPRKNYEENTAVCLNFAKNMKKANEENLYLYGSAGLGKTFLCSAIAEYVMKNGYSVLYYSAFELLQSGAATLDELLPILSETDLLILDDLGTEYATQYSTAILFHIINQRLINRKKTVISSNLSPNELANVYSPRIASRIGGAYTLLPFFGKDLRRDFSDRKEC